MQIFLIIFPVTNEKTKKFSSKISKKLYDVYYKISIFSRYKWMTPRSPNWKKPRSSILKNTIVQCIWKNRFSSVINNKQRSSILKNGAVQYLSQKLNFFPLLTNKPRSSVRNNEEFV